MIILFVLLAASPSQQDAIQALYKALTQVTTTSVKVAYNLEQKFLLTNTFQAFQAVFLIKEEKKTQYNCGTLFVDHCSGYIHHKNQVSLRIGEPLKGKHNFECFAKQFNVKIKHYHADNAPFGANEFKADIANQDQELTFYGVGAHHQNGIAERSIRTVTQWARAILIHSTLHWPEVADLKLWPFALDHVIII
jgi:hypothetical protein